MHETMKLRIKAVNKGDDKKQHHRKLTPAETIERANYLQSILDELTAWVDSAKKAKGGD